MTILNQITTVKKEIMLAITYGDYQVEKIESVDDWQRLKVNIEGLNFWISIKENTSFVIFHDLELISELLTDEDKNKIHNELINYELLTA